MIFSVITVTRNDLDHLRRTVASVQTQTHRHYEHLIVDGASDDGTVEWLKGLDDPHIRWVSEPDRGIYDAMNKAAAMANGGLLVFLNAGDTFRDPNVLARIHTAHWKGMWDWSYGRALVVDAEGRPSRPDYGLKRYTPFRHAYTRVALCHQTVAMRREFFHQLGGFREEQGQVADFALLLRAGIASRPGVRPTVDVDYLDGGVSYVNPHTQIQKHRARVDAFGYGAAGTVLDRGFWLFQELLGAARRAVKRTAKAAGAQSLIERWAGRRV